MARKKPKQRRKRYQAPIAGHKRERKKLVAPMNTLPNMRATNWVADWLPELLWAAAMLREYGHPEPAWRGGGRSTALRPTRPPGKAGAGPRVGMGHGSENAALIGLSAGLDTGRASS
jgi:hypothetical protein